MADIQKQLSDIPDEVGVYVEPEYFKRLQVKKNVKKAAFTEKMFSSIRAASIRPGLGTVCDVLSKGGRIFSFCEQDNFEAAHNAQVLKKLKVGEDPRTISQAIRGAVGYLYDEKKRQQHYSQIKKLDFKGLEDTVSQMKIILN